MACHYVAQIVMVLDSLFEELKKKMRSVEDPGAFITTTSYFRKVSSPPRKCGVVRSESFQSAYSLHRPAFTVTFWAGAKGI